MMHNQRHATRTRSRRSSVPLLMEALEQRQLLSITVDPLLTLSPSATSSPSGYSPSQIAQAYGFNQLPRGGGQTIAIVDAYRDPNIASDLHTFDQNFGLNDPTLSIVNQNGGSADSVPTDAGWSTETALDVEWAHAMAPKAKILLVEANSADLGDLMSAVDYARHAAGVSVVSMSWGGGEFAGQQQFDSLFTTPSGHQGVTFVAASGDSGSWFGPSWPASSPNVLSVGGTNLSTTSTGAYGSETGWAGSTGGISSVYSEPAYQANAQQTGGRTSPDVAYAAGGFAVYSSVPDQGTSGWSVVGGTSAGAPQWAALIAIANQLRAVAGKATLDGATATLPMLYAMYSPLGAAGYAAYTAAFHDITSGASSWFYSAHAGYDGVTGLGSPKAPQVVAALTGSTAKTKATTTASAPSPAATLRTAKAAVIRQAAPAAVATVAPAAPTPARAPAAVFANTLLSGPGHAGPTAASSAGTLALAARATDATASFIAWELAGQGERPIGAAPAARATQLVEHAAGETVAAVATMADEGTAAVKAIVAEHAPQIVQANTLAVMATDGIVGLARESAMLGAMLTNEFTSSHTRAKQITAITLAADAMLVGFWAKHLWDKRRNAQIAASQRADEPMQLLTPDEEWLSDSTSP